MSNMTMPMHPSIVRLRDRLLNTRRRGALLPTLCVSMLFPEGSSPIVNQRRLEREIELSRAFPLRRILTIGWILGEVEGQPGSEVVIERCARWLNESIRLAVERRVSSPIFNYVLALEDGNIYSQDECDCIRRVRELVGDGREIFK